MRADPAAYGADAAKVSRFERLLVALDQTVFAAGLFSACVEQDFEAVASADGGGPGGVIDIRNNGVFLAEFMNNVGELLRKYMRVVNTPTETDERLKIVGVFGLYVLHGRLLPARAAPTTALYQKLWEVQKKVPVVPLFGKAFWLPPEFLLQHAAQPTKKLSPAEEQIPQARFLLRPTVPRLRAPRC